jgi:hypothetical protein
MKLQELIDHLNQAKQKVGGNVEVKLFSMFDDYYEESSSISDIVLKGEQSLMNKSSNKDATVLIYFI